jgi:flagellar biosynthesis anti-sigma factor FlgM
MKIDPKIQFPNDSQPERVSGKRANDVAPKSGSQTTGLSPTAGEDTVSLSGKHGDVQRLTAAVAQVPEVRAERIAALQSKVQSGNYKPDSEKIADAVISEQSTRKFKA